MAKPAAFERPPEIGQYYLCKHGSYSGKDGGDVLVAVVVGFEDIKLPGDSQPTPHVKLQHPLGGMIHTKKLSVLMDKNFCVPEHIAERIVTLTDAAMIEAAKVQRGPDGHLIKYAVWQKEAYTKTRAECVRIYKAMCKSEFTGYEGSGW